MHEMPLVDTIHLRKVGHIRQEDIDLDHALNIRSRFSKNGDDVFDARFSLLLDVPFN